MGLISRVSSRTYRRTSKMTQTQQQSTLNKALYPPKKGAHTWESEEFLDVIYWSHNILSVIFGIAWGILGLTGSFGLVSYVVLSSFIMVMYAASYQDLDLEEFGGATGIAKEGFMNRFALFLVCWILTNSSMVGVF